MRLQLELSQVKVDMDRRLEEKEEEFEATRYLQVHFPIPTFQEVSYDS